MFLKYFLWKQNIKQQYVLYDTDDCFPSPKVFQSHDVSKINDS